MILSVTHRRQNPLDSTELSTHVSPRPQTDVEVQLYWVLISILYEGEISLHIRAKMGRRDSQSSSWNQTVYQVTLFAGISCQCFSETYNVCFWCGNSKTLAWEDPGETAEHCITVAGRRVPRHSGRSMKRFLRASLQNKWKCLPPLQ
jgi:hypothetical protein